MFCFAGVNEDASYVIAVKTGDVFGAGTMANVFIQLHGRLATSPDFPLVNAINGHKAYHTVVLNYLFIRKKPLSGKPQ